MTSIRVSFVTSILLAALSPDLSAKEPVHFSDRPDQQGTGAGCINGPDTGQILYTLIPDNPGGSYPSNSFDVVPLGEVDALAWHSDTDFDEIISGGGELLISFEQDANSIAVYYEKITQRGPLWDHTDFASDCDTSGLDDLDALSTHGPENNGGGYYYSVETDASATSILYFTGTASSAYLSRADIFTALTSLDPPFTGIESQVDIDAFMIKDSAGDNEFGAGDEILFSIVPAANFHGGELVHLAYGGTPDYLTRAGYRWDPSFDPRLIFGIPLDKPKNADSVDSKRSEPEAIPTLSGWALIFLLLLLLTIGSAALSRWGKRFST